MKHTHQFVNSLAATLITISFLVEESDAALSITDITGVATSSFYAYTDGSSADRLGIPAANDNFWTISVESMNVLLFDTQLNVGGASLALTLSGLESNDDWASALVSSTGGSPTLDYTGGDTATLNFNNGASYAMGDQIRVSFAAVPEPSTLFLVGVGFLGFTLRRHVNK